jgi:geranyl-CoA carboxylase beta subunit
MAIVAEEAAAARGLPFARLWDDGLIDPRTSRATLAFCLDTCAESDARALRPNAFGVPRF